MRSVIHQGSPLLLASQSPRRRELLTQLRVPFEVTPVNVAEEPLAGESPSAYLERIASEKLASALQALEGRRGSPVLAADTIVVLDEEVLGKPGNDAHAAHMLQRLSGRTHQVMTRFAIGVVGEGALLARTVVTEVSFRDLESDEVAGYVASGEGRDKAGGYAVQGLGAFAVAGIQGSYSCVVGLPLAELVRALLDLRLLTRFPILQDDHAAL